MYAVNQTGNWLASKDHCTKSAIVAAAMTEAHGIEKRDKMKLKEKMKEKLEQSRKQLQDKDDKLRAQNEQCLEKVYQSGGLWENQQDMDANIAGLSQTKARSAINAQFTMHARILKRNLGCAHCQDQVHTRRTQSSSCEPHVC